MRKTLTTLAFLGMLPAGMAVADDDCFVPMADWQPRAAVAQLADDNNWTLRRIRIDDGCYEIDGSDAAGQRIKEKVHPRTLKILGIKTKDSADLTDDERAEHKHK